MKTIIVVQGRSEIGKTPAIVEVFKKFDNLSTQYGIAEKPEYHGREKDIEVEMEYKKNNKLIGISSMGDPESDLKGRLKHHVKNNCEVILTSSRTSGSTVADIMEIARPKDKKKRYDIIWTKHYCHEGDTGIMPNGKDVNTHLNEQFAKGMVDLIQSLLQ
jgi:hypothetical protein